jgi:hypothetical protein
MAKSQDSGGNAAQQNPRPASHDEDAMPEMSEDIRGRADDDDDEFEDADDLDEADEEDESDEGKY